MRETIDGFGFFGAMSHVFLYRKDGWTRELAQQVHNVMLEAFYRGKGDWDPVNKCPIVSYGDNSRGKGY